MIPLKLELKNFLSYGDSVEQIDFRDYSLICFSGKNGNGKSAILDAITWVIWGQARKTSGTVKPDFGLLRLGQTRMFVSLEFEFSKNIYRVRREFSKTYGKPYFALDFEYWDQSAQKFVALTDKTVRQTQFKIEDLLGLDYETFVNSAFLRQGAADEFSKKTPKERKQILANILGFTKYDEFQNLAIDQARIFIDEKKINEKLQEQIDEQLKQEDPINKQLDEQKNSLEKINLDFENLNNSLNTLQKDKDLFIQKKQKYEFWLEERKKTQQKLDTKLKDFKHAVLCWKNVHYKSLYLPDFRLLENEKNSLIQQEKYFLELQQKNLALREQILHKTDLYQKEVRNFKDRIEKELYEKRFLIEKGSLELRQLLDLLGQKTSEKELLETKIRDYKKEVSEITQEVKKQDIKAKVGESTKAQFDKRKAFYQAFVQKGNWIKVELTELEQKIKAIKEQTSPCCPLCEQLLSVKRKSFLNSKFQKDFSFLNHQLNRITFLLKKLKEMLLQQHEQLKAYEQNDAACKQLIAKKDELEKVLIKDESDLKVLGELLDKIGKESNALGKRNELLLHELKQQESLVEIEIKNDKKIKVFVQELEGLEKDKAGLNYDKNKHLELQEKLKNIEIKLKDLENIKQALLEQKERRGKIAILNSELKEFKQLILKIDSNIKDLNFNEKIESLLAQKIVDFKRQINQNFLEKDKILQNIGSIENEIKRLQNFKEQKEKKKLHTIFLDEQIEEYKILSQALGKDGIQALLIEQVIPQIEEEANNILSRLTDNQAQIFIESLRDLKSGGVKETLDIQISDSAGIRPYEMFSGGEAFRVDFALRIAISKLLAHRAGTALQTLIIDEGFGSQDEEGLGRLMDAIYAIQKDFSKIIIVSHLTTFKDNFPVHFMIEKGPSGSFVRVEERG